MMHGVKVRLSPRKKVGPISVLSILAGEIVQLKSCAPRDTSAQCSGASVIFMKPTKI